MPKIIIVIIIIIIVMGLGYWLYQSTLSPEEETKEEVEDRILTLLENLEQETGIDFSEIRDVEFKWIVKVDPETAEEIVTGKGFESERILSKQYDSIHPFFIDNDFEADVYNFAAGTISGLTGYKKDKSICAVIGGLTGYKEAEGQWIPPEPDKWDVTVKCGKLEKTYIEYATEKY